LQFLYFFKLFVLKAYVFESFTWVIIHLDSGFYFRTFKLKNHISYIKYKFSHEFAKVCKWLNMYYSKIKITTFQKIIAMSIWIILNNLVWIYREYKFCQYWVTQSYIHHIFSELEKGEGGVGGGRGKGAGGGDAIFFLYIF